MRRRPLYGGEFMPTKKHKKRGKGHGTPAKKKTSWVNIVALVLMLCAIFAYVATLDEGDPEAIPNAEDTLNSESP